MAMKRFILVALAFWCGAATASETASFDVYLLGIKAGRITMSAAMDGGRYAATGRISSAGVAEALTDVRIEAEVAGRLSGSAPAPVQYKERLKIGREEVTKSLTYAAGTPRFETTEDAERHWLDPAEQAGTIDPMTAVWELLRTRTSDELCGLDTVFFDGARKGSLVARNGADSGDERTCVGTYERLGGFSKKELRAGTSFPFTLVYEPQGDGWAVKRMDIQSTRGRAQIIRR